MHFQKYFPRKGLTKLENHRKSDLIGDPAGADRPADRVCKGNSDGNRRGVSDEAGEKRSRAPCDLERHSS